MLYACVVYKKQHNNYTQSKAIRQQIKSELWRHKAAHVGNGKDHCIAKAKTGRQSQALCGAH